MGLFGTKLRPGKAYMLRNDGELFELGRDVLYTHPYIKYWSDWNLDDMIENIVEDSEQGFVMYLRWISKHTKSNEVKSIIQQIRTGLCSYCLQYNEAVASDLLEKLDVDPVDCKDDWSDEDTKKLQSMINICNDAVNQEFCRVRVGSYRETSGNNGDAYFRISSTNFDWFPSIYECVSDAKRNLETITICRDEQATGTDTCYRHKGEVIAKMPIDTFLTLSGRPIVECYTEPKDVFLYGVARRLSQGRGLVESMHDITYYHMHQAFNKLSKKYTREYFN